jgi:flagellar assembly factor FliW
LKVSTSRFGTIEIQDDQIIHMPSGIIGFPDDKRYVLFEHKKGSPFLWLQSLDNPSLAFVLVDPHQFKPDYEIQVSPEDSIDLELNHASNGIQTLVIANISSGNLMKVTANLLAPLIINVQKKLAKQVILYQSPYSHNHVIPLMKEEKAP